MKAFLVAVLAGSLFVSTTRAADAPKPKPTPAFTEERLAELERQLETILKQVQELRQELAAAKQLTVIALKNVEAVKAAKELTPIFGNAGAEALADQRTNTIILRGTREQIAQAKAVLAELDK